jgi:hypothetical protein
MKRQTAALLSLLPCERALLVFAWFWLLVADLALLVLPLARVRRLLTVNAPPTRLGKETPSAERLARLIEIAARHHLYPMTCLRRALVLERWLKQRGLTTDLKIGVRREGSLLRAHAWVEHGGKPIAEHAEVAVVFMPLLGEG